MNPYDMLKQTLGFDPSMLGQGGGAAPFSAMSMPAPQGDPGNPLGSLSASMQMPMPAAMDAPGDGLVDFSSTLGSLANLGAPVAQTDPNYVPPPVTSPPPQQPSPVPSAATAAAGPYDNLSFAHRPMAYRGPGAAERWRLENAHKMQRGAGR